VAVGCFIYFLKASLHFPMRLSRSSSASVNQSGCVLISDMAMSNAAEVICSSKLSNSSDGVEKIDVSLRLSKYSSTFFKNKPKWES